VESAIEQLSNDVLKSIFEAAFLEAEIDEDGDLFVKDTYKVWVHGMLDRDCFEFKCFIGIGDGFSRQQVLEPATASMAPISGSRYRLCQIMMVSASPIKF